MFALVILALALSSCENKEGYKDKLDEIKQKYSLPIDAVVIKELGTPTKDGKDNTDDMWCLFVLGGDTILYHNHSSGSNIYESMCRVSWTAAQKTTAEAEEEETEGRTE